jgi:hypothetical protein
MGGMPSTRARVWVTSFTLAAVMMTLSGVPCPSQIRWCLLPVFRPPTGDGPVSGPLFRALRQQLRGHVTAGQQTHRSGLKGVDGGTRVSAAPMGAASRRKEELVYIGLGTVVVIIVIVAVVMMLRRR